MHVRRELSMHMHKVKGTSSLAYLSFELGALLLVTRGPPFPVGLLASTRAVTHLLASRALHECGVAILSLKAVIHVRILIKVNFALAEALKAHIISIPLDTRAPYSTKNLELIVPRLRQRQMRCVDLPLLAVLSCEFFFGTHATAGDPGLQKLIPHVVKAKLPQLISRLFRGLFISFAEVGWHRHALLLKKPCTPLLC